MAGKKRTTKQRSSDKKVAEQLEHAFLAGLGAAVFNVPGLSLAVSAAFIMLMGGKILYDTSALIHGGETNYIMATVSLYVSIYNLFLSLLHLLGAFAGER